MEVFEKILKGSLILESFGNSRIRTNPNSSRYGQYLRIGFNQSGALVTGHFKGYLLQNSLGLFDLLVLYYLSCYVHYYFILIIHNLLYDICIYIYIYIYIYISVQTISERE